MRKRHMLRTSNLCVISGLHTVYWQNIRSIFSIVETSVVNKCQNNNYDLQHVFFLTAQLPEVLSVQPKNSTNFQTINLQPCYSLLHYSLQVKYEVSRRKKKEKKKVLIMEYNNRQKKRSQRHVRPGPASTKAHV